MPQVAVPPSTSRQEDSREYREIGAAAFSQDLSALPVDVTMDATTSETHKLLQIEALEDVSVSSNDSSKPGDRSGDQSHDVGVTDRGVATETEGSKSKFATKWKGDNKQKE